MCITACERLKACMRCILTPSQETLIEQVTTLLLQWMTLAAISNYDQIYWQSDTLQEFNQYSTPCLVPMHKVRHPCAHLFNSGCVYVKWSAVLFLVHTYIGAFLSLARTSSLHVRPRSVSRAVNHFSSIMEPGIPAVIIIYFLHEHGSHPGRGMIHAPIKFRKNQQTMGILSKKIEYLISCLSGLRRHHVKRLSIIHEDAGEEGGRGRQALLQNKFQSFRLKCLCRRKHLKVSFISQ